MSTATPAILKIVALRLRKDRIKPTADTDSGDWWVGCGVLGLEPGFPVEGGTVGLVES